MDMNACMKREAEEVERAIDEHVRTLEGEEAAPSLLPAFAELAPIHSTAIRKLWNESALIALPSEFSIKSLNETE